MIILLTASGLFSLHKNPHASTFLKLLTVSNVAIRFSCTLIASTVYLATLYVNGTSKLASNIQAVIYGFYCLINVSFLLGFHFHSKGVELLKIVGCNIDMKKNWATRAFVITLSVYMLCTTSSLIFNGRALFNETSRRNDIMAFHPFKDHNSLESFLSISTTTFVLSSGDYLCAMYYSYMCIVIFLKYKNFNEELELSVETNSLIRNADIEEERKKYNHLQNIVNDFNSSHSFMMVFNITIWVLMICTISYIAITLHVNVNAYFILLIMNVVIILFVQLFAASLLYSEVGAFLLGFHQMDSDNFSSIAKCFKK